LPISPPTVPPTPGYIAFPIALPANDATVPPIAFPIYLPFSFCSASSALAGS